MNFISFSKKIPNFNKDKIIKKTFCTKSAGVHEDFKTTRALIIEIFRTCPSNTGCFKKIKELKVIHLDMKELMEHKGWKKEDMDLLSNLYRDCACKNNYPAVRAYLENYFALYLQVRAKNKSLVEAEKRYSEALYREKCEFGMKLAEEPFRAYEDYLKLCKEYKVLCEGMHLEKKDVSKKLEQLGEAEPWLNIVEDCG